VQSRTRLANRGFTLIEVMITVVLIGILAGLGVYGVGKYIRTSKTSEATRMIASIKAAQESYKGETFAYLDVSGAKSVAALTSFYPRTTPDTKIHGWGDVSTTVGQRWRELGVRPDGPVYFAYGCAAGSAADAVSGHGSSQTVTNWPANVTAPWYVVRAVGDLDGDGTRSNFVSASFTDQIIVDKEDE
jgi:prepilin-type N-terminal cleavage/methylation domain-containing protein